MVQTHWLGLYKNTLSWVIQEHTDMGYTITHWHGLYKNTFLKPIFEL